MCGITGYLDRKGVSCPGLLDRMIRSLYSRGPDGEGRFIDGPAAIGMRRLAILDPAGGDQPFSTEDGRFVAMLNGEIYNHRELRARLESRGVGFKTQCDAEILPYAFREWGPQEFPRMLDGMFGISILDTVKRWLYLYRDRYGEKPIFYRDGKERFSFASQLATITLDPEFDFDVDPQALRYYLFVHYVPGSRTIFEQIRRLEPGYRLSVAWDRRDPPRVDRWADHATGFDRGPVRYRSAVEGVRRRLKEAVRSRLISDVPIGVFLSGGLDSSAIAAAAMQETSALQTFSVGFEDADLDESEHAKAVARHLSTKHHHFQFDLEACLSVLDEAMASLDEPLGDPACLPLLLLSKEARRHVKVVLTGEGADEFFAGYGYYPRPRTGATTRGWLWRSFVPRVRSLLHERRRFGGLRIGTAEATESFFRSDNSTPSGFPGLTNAGERDRLVPSSIGDEDDWSREVVRYLSGFHCDVRRAQMADVLSWLDGDLLPKLDHMTMAASLEGRAPFLDPRIAEYALGLPAEWKMDATDGKKVLRDAVAEWLPSEIRTRRKQGFVLPIQEWLLGPLRERLLDGLTADRNDGLDVGVARRLALEDLSVGAPRARFLYALLAYREWMSAIRERRASAIRHAEHTLG